MRWRRRESEERTLFENIRATLHADTADSERKEHVAIDWDLEVTRESHEMRLEAGEEGRKSSR